MTWRKFLHTQAATMLATDSLIAAHPAIIYRGSKNSPSGRAAPLKAGKLIQN